MNVPTKVVSTVIAIFTIGAYGRVMRVFARIHDEADAIFDFAKYADQAQTKRIEELKETLSRIEEWQRNYDPRKHAEELAEKEWCEENPMALALEEVTGKPDPNRPKNKRKVE